MSKKILIIEDDSFLQNMASKKLKGIGYEVQTADNADEASKALESSTPSLVLLDLLLPGVDGFEVLAKIRANDKTKSIPVLVFSNLSEDQDIKRCKDLGVSGFIVKSTVTMDELVNKINSILS